MNVAVIGLGRMGEAVAERMVQAGHTVFGFDLNAQSRANAQKKGIIAVTDINQFAHHAVDAFWLFLPQGAIIDKVLENIVILAQPHAIIIDGGNSKFTDSVRRAKEMVVHQLRFLDCGTSGGIHGKENGFCLMVGGERDAYERAEPLFAAVACPNGYAYMGASGTGHYVKMIHNGIEYGLLQAYAEGFNLLKNGEFKDHNLDLEKIADVWNHGSVIRSWILELVHDIMRDEQLIDSISGAVDATGMGAWTVEEAHKTGIPVPVIEESLRVRNDSRVTGGDYATKVVALLRNKFGGHAYLKK